MKNKFLKRMLLFCSVVLVSAASLSACGRSDELPDVSASPPAENPFADLHEDIRSGSITHGVNHEVVGSGVFAYSGGKVEIPYFATAQGFVTKAGFLIFVDGVPQPYQLDNPDSDYAYLHQVDLEDNVQKNFQFLFEPVTGEVGDTLDIHIISVTGTTDDTTENLLFGSVPGYLMYRLSLQYSESRGTVDYGLEGLSSVLTNAVESEEELTLDKVSFYTDSGMIDDGSASDLNTYTYEKLYINDEDIQLKATQNTNGKSKLKLRHVMLGHPGVKYRTTFFLDFVPLNASGQYSFESDLKDGIANLLDAELDVSTLRGRHILCVVSVPCNAADYPDDPIDVNILQVLLDGTKGADDEN